MILNPDEFDLLRLIRWHEIESTLTDHALHEDAIEWLTMRLEIRKIDKVALTPGEQNE